MTYIVSSGALNSTHSPVGVYNMVQESKSLPHLAKKSY